MDDKELIERIGSGDKSSLRELYLRYNGPIYAFLMSRCNNAELCSDCVQDTMLNVIRAASQFSGKSSVKTWLFTIARNKLVDALRKRGKLTLVEEFPESEDSAPNPEVAAVAAQERDRLRSCIDKLGETHRAAIRLAFFEELTYPEIAEIEDVPIGTVKTRIYHAKQALMRCLEMGLRR